MGVHQRHRRYIVVFLVFAFALGVSLVIGMVNGEIEKNLLNRQQLSAAAVVPRRSLVGPGSSPPLCFERCGRCFPCSAVHVAIQPGRSTLLEYYPEAWRCKCGSKLFMP